MSCAEKVLRDGHPDGFAAGAYVELAQDRGDVVVDGLDGEVEARGDLGVAEPVVSRARTSTSRRVRPAGLRRVVV
jgi:hypothetical protein